MTAGRDPLSEKDFQQQIVDLAQVLGWRVYHTHDSRRSEPGFPDLVLVRDRVVYLEVKAETGRVSAAQAEWIAALSAAGATALVVRPSDTKRIEDALARRVKEAAAA